VAVIVFGAAASWYLHRAAWKWPFAGSAGGVLAVFLIVCVPIIAQQREDGTHDVRRAERVASQIDVMLVTDGSVHAPPAAVAADPALARFDVRYSVGFADGDAVSVDAHLDRQRGGGVELRFIPNRRDLDVADHPVRDPPIRPEEQAPPFLVAYRVAVVVEEHPELHVRDATPVRWASGSRLQGPPGAAPRQPSRGLNTPGVKPPRP
jgi:hypothetical protein